MPNKESLNTPWRAVEIIEQGPDEFPDDQDYIERIEIHDSMGWIRATLHLPTLTGSHNYKKELGRAQLTAQAIVTHVNSGQQVMKDLAPLLSNP